MNEDKITDIVIKITAELSALNANMKNVLDRLTSHEQRISALENGKSSMKDTVVQWLVKGLIASIFIIGSLTGAGGILKGLFGL